MRMLQYEERNNDSCKRYNRHLPLKQEKERQENQMFQQRIRTQTAKPVKSNKYDMTNKQLNSNTNEIGSNAGNVNGTFTDQSGLMQQIQQVSLDK